MALAAWRSSSSQHDGQLLSGGGQGHPLLGQVGRLDPVRDLPSGQEEPQGGVEAVAFESDAHPVAEHQGVLVGGGSRGGAALGELGTGFAAIGSRVGVVAW
jgi:hypothetical protein